MATELVKQPHLSCRDGCSTDHGEGRGRLKRVEATGIFIVGVRLAEKVMSCAIKASRGGREG